MTDARNWNFIGINILGLNAHPFPQYESVFGSHKIVTDIEGVKETITDVKRELDRRISILVNDKEEELGDPYLILVNEAAALLEELPSPMDSKTSRVSHFPDLMDKIIRRGKPVGIFWKSSYGFVPVENLILPTL